MNASSAAVYRAIGSDENDPPTLLVDEADALFGSRKAAEANEELRGLLNAGHQRNRPAIRYDSVSRTIERIPTFAMAALAGIGQMPDTIEDRAVIVKMRRRAPGEEVQPYRHRRDGPTLRGLALALGEWLRADLDALSAAEPPMPVEDRAADTWEPLVAVADHAAGDWPDRVRTAAKLLTAEQGDTGPASLSAALLADCRTAFGDTTAIPTEELLARLRDDQEAPWVGLGPTGITARRLGALLGEYGIHSTNIRFTDGTQRKGYNRSDFTDAWARYCEGDPSQPSQVDSPRSARDGNQPRDGTIRPADATRPALTSADDVGTDGTAPTPGCDHLTGAVCLDCWTRRRNTA